MEVSILELIHVLLTRFPQLGFGSNSFKRGPCIYIFLSPIYNMSYKHRDIYKFVGQGQTVSVYKDPLLLCLNDANFVPCFSFQLKNIITSGLY